MQFPKIEAGQNKFNYLGINIVAFLLTHGGQDSLRLQKTSAKEVLWGLFLLCPGDNGIDTSYLNSYFFRLWEKCKVFFSQMLSVVLEQFHYLTYAEFFDLTFPTSVET